MRIDLVLSGSDAIKSNFRSMSDELDKLNRKMDSFGTKSQSAGAKAAKGFADIASSDQGLSTPTNTTSATPPKVPNIVPALVRTLPALASGGGTSNFASLATSALGKFSGVTAIATLAVTGLAAASMKAAEAIRSFGDFAFNARGFGDSRALAGVSKAAGVSLDEAAGLARQRAGGASQLQREIDQLRYGFDKSKEGEEGAARYAQSRGIEGYRSVRNMSESDYQNAQNISTPSQAQVAGLDSATAHANASFAELANTVNVILIPIATVFKGITSVVADGLNFILAPLKALSDLLTNGMDFGRQQDKAADKQVEAANRMHEAANKIHDTIAGGGNRTRQALAPAQIWYQNRHDMDKQINSMGSI